MYRPSNSPPFVPSGTTGQQQGSTTPPFSPSSPVYGAVTRAADLPPLHPSIKIPTGWEVEIVDYQGHPLRVFHHLKSGKKFIEPPMMPMSAPEGLTMQWNGEGGIDFIDEATGDLAYTVEGDTVGVGIFPPPYPASPLYSPSSPAYYPQGSPNAAVLTAQQYRPPSSAWNAVPVTGDANQAAVLRSTTPEYPPPEEEEYDELPPGPLVDGNMEASDVRNAYDEYQDQKRNIEERARARIAPTLAANLSAEDREARLTAAANAAVAAAIERYRRSRAEGLVTAVVEGGGGRTVAVERATVAGPQKKYKASDIFRFFGRAELKDNLGIQDPGAARWLALSAPFPIEDKGIEYPTVNHYLAAMKYKLATDKPELAADIFSSKGTIHTKYLRQREQIAVQHKGDKEKRQVKEHEDQELLRAEAADVADAALPKTIKRYKAQFNEAKWIASKDDVLKEALTQRWKHDARFRKIVEAARAKEKYLLYYTGSSTISSFGGIRREDGRIEGENQVGKILMELAGYPPV